MISSMAARLREARVGVFPPESDVGIRLADEVHPEPVS